MANAGSRWLLSGVVSYEAAVALAYLVGMAVAFVLMRHFVFRGAAAPPAETGRQALRFAAVNLGGLAQVWMVSVGLARLVFPAIGFRWHVDTVAHLVGLGSVTVTSYLAHRHFSFRGDGPAGASATDPRGRAVQMTTAARRIAARTVGGP